MDISFFFQRLPEIFYEEKNPARIKNSMRSIIHPFVDEFPEAENCDIAIIGCTEERGAKPQKGSAQAPDAIRKHFYNLAAPEAEVKICDLGNLVPKENIIDYYFQIAHVCETLLRENKTIILLGGSEDICFGQHLGYENLDRDVNCVSIDAAIDIQNSDDGITNRSVFHKIFTYSPNYLSNFTNLGCQSHLVNRHEKNILEALHFDYFRLGHLKENISECEPALRNADWVNFDISSIRQSDAPGNNSPMPTGWSTDEACKLARYAGISQHISSISFTDVNSLLDQNEQSARLTAILIWYFIEGFYNRLHDKPSADKSNLVKYNVTFKGGMHEIIFYKHKLSHRWWMEIPNPKNKNNQNYSMNNLIPCSETDYLLATHDEIPQRWWNAQAKMKT